MSSDALDNFGSYSLLTLENSARDTLYMWKIYAKVFPEDLVKLAPCRSFSPYPKLMQTRDYYNLITSDDLCWGALLSISTQNLQLSELAGIAKLTNLAALELMSPTRTTVEMSPAISLTDRVLRIWSELACSGNAFQHLRLLILRCQRELTERIFSYLDHFPSLEAVLVVGCPMLSRLSTVDVARVHGWKSNDVSAVRNCIAKHYQTLKSNDDACEDGKKVQSSTLPLLHVSLWGKLEHNPGPENQRWFTRSQPKARKRAQSSKRKVESKTSEGKDRSKKPTLRSLNRNHMKKNNRLVQELFRYVLLSHGGPDWWLTDSLAAVIHAKLHNSLRND